MKISRAEIGKVIKVYMQHAKGEDEEAERQRAGGTESPQGDMPDLSSQRVVQRLRPFHDRVPSIRGDLVKPIAEGVASGEYRVEADKVADQMIARMLGDKLI